jgi:hypothetical protein
LLKLEVLNFNVLTAVVKLGADELKTLVVSLKMGPISGFSKVP